MLRVVNRPWLHFLALGAILFLLSGLVESTTLAGLLGRCPPPASKPCKVNGSVSPAGRLTRRSWKE